MKKKIGFKLFFGRQIYNLKIFKKDRDLANRLLAIEDKISDKMSRVISALQHEETTEKNKFLQSVRP